MRKKLKDLFNQHAKAVKRTGMVLGLGAACALGADAMIPPVNFPQPGAPAPMQIMEQETTPAVVTNVNDGVMYWKHKDYDIVAKTWPCEDRGLCASFQSINPKDARNRELMAELKGYYREDEYGFGRQVPDTDRVQDWQMTDFCGYQPDVKLKKQDDGSWDGTITSPFNGGTYGLTVRQQDDGRLKISGYFTAIPFLSLSEKVDRVDNPPPQCQPDWQMLFPPPPAA